ncbi:VOC family protein [Actinoalloteichus caeruleus]|uniref:Glyoxalase-like domain-containing protein n=1 Tax=Actinoalloteichus caeruleus DSM 43889 TaxID=1120930 RepID=A0ABT1JHH5_ACTCY|nr:VOC family protein [Actinoalloteichus caeruleus]MCP2331633.1 Glyoxalase-like domain-containing protein [Actinoalloteichus caeruleus DSM 43889]
MSGDNATPFALRLPSPLPGPVVLDHLVLAVADLPSATEYLRSLGFDARPGGRHPGHGTENALVVLDGQYLELISVTDPEEASASDLGRSTVRALSRDGGGWVGYALRLPPNTPVDGGSLAAPERAEPHRLSMSRTTPGGERVSWELFFPERVGMDGPYPFLIRWDGASPTSGEPPEHPNVVHGVGELTIGMPGPGSAPARWYADSLPRLTGAPAHTVEDASAHRSVGLASVELTSTDLGRTRRALASAGAAWRAVEADPASPAVLLTLPPALFGEHTRLTIRQPAPSRDR